MNKIYKSLNNQSPIYFFKSLFIHTLNHQHHHFFSEQLEKKNLKKYNKKCDFFENPGKKPTPPLKYGKSESTSGDPNNIIIHSGGDEAEGLGTGEPVEVLAVPDGGGGSVGAGHTLGVTGGHGDDGHVGQLAVVGTSQRVEADKVEGIGVHMVAGDNGDDRGGVVGLDVRIVIGTHIGETLSVLVDEGGVGDGVVTGEIGVEDQTGGRPGVLKHLGLTGGVVGPVGGDGDVLGGEEKHLDGVRETDVKVVGTGGGEGLLRGGLDLLDEDITRSTGHPLTLVVGDNGVVGPHLDVVGDGDGRGRQIRRHHHGTSGLDVELGGVGAVGRVHLPDVEKIRQVTETEEDPHVVIRKSGSGKSHTRVTGVEERKGKVEGLYGEALGRIDQLGGVSNHIVVTHLLASRGGEGTPEIKVEVVETGRHEIVEGDAALTDEIVHEIGCPGDVLLVQVIGKTTLGLGGRGGIAAGRLESDQTGESDTEPGVEKIITGTRDGHGPVVTEIGRTGGTGETDGDLGEPGSTTGLTDEVGGGILTTVHVLFKLIVGRKIDETGGKIGSTVLRHHRLIKL